MNAGLLRSDVLAELPLPDRGQFLKASLLDAHASIVPWERLRQ